MAVWELEAFLVLRISLSNENNDIRHTHSQGRFAGTFARAGKQIILVRCPLSMAPNGKYFGSTTHPPVVLVSQGLIHVELAFASTTFIHLGVGGHSSP
jgi:hypothetical protein